LNTPRHHRHLHLELAGIYRFHRHRGLPAARNWLIWDLLHELHGQGVSRQLRPHQKQQYQNGKYVIAHQPAHHHIAPMNRIRRDMAKQRGPLAPADEDDIDEDDITDVTGRVRGRPKAKTKAWTAKVQGAILAVLPKAFPSKITPKSEHPYEAETDFDEDYFNDDYYESCPRDTFVDYFNNRGEAIGKSSFGDHVAAFDERYVDDNITDILKKTTDVRSNNYVHHSETGYINIEPFSGDHVTEI
jgi:hypothetical protein